MQRAGFNDIVRVHYTGTLDDGVVFDSSAGREPLEFVLGEGMLLEQFEQTVMGMAPGETREVRVPAAGAYGPHHPDMVVEFNRSQFPPSIDPKVGYTIEIKADNGEVIPAVIIDVTDTTVTLDANHPLAGKDLNFKIQLLEILGKGDGGGHHTHGGGCCGH